MYICHSHDFLCKYGIKVLIPCKKKSLSKNVDVRYFLEIKNYKLKRNHKRVKEPYQSRSRYLCVAYLWCDWKIFKNLNM